ncbi:oxidoreductase [Lithospermum erythrorhizon]|uniref:Oxidoreductase n=1 Tax=Lithospermum erythrorhizon TaxID=34254 RepID=A0AAV3PPG6_LITER
MYNIRPMWEVQSPKMATNVLTRHGQYQSLYSSSKVISFHSPSKWEVHFEETKRSNRLMVVYFTASWCGPCRLMEPVINNFSNQYTSVEFIKIDVDELMGVAEAFVVRAMPTFLLIKRGDVLDRVVGAKKEDLQMKIEKHRI